MELGLVAVFLTVLVPVVFYLLPPRESLFETLSATLRRFREATHVPGVEPPSVGWSIRVAPWWFLVVGTGLAVETLLMDLPWSLVPLLVLVVSLSWTGYIVQRLFRLAAEFADTVDEYLASREEAPPDEEVH